MSTSTLTTSAIFLLCSAISSIVDLKDPIQYIDGSQSYFIGIQGSRYQMGTATDAIIDPDEDAPQFSGEIKDCSSEIFNCKSIAFLKFVVPKSQVETIVYDEGPRITIKHLSNGGFSASAICPTVLPAGCTSGTHEGDVMITYQYVISRKGVLIAIKIQHWSDGIQIGHEDLLLSSRQGMMIANKGDGGN